jgi:aryl-alcohol dehydrogenase-like predicted oxidoreductase
MVQEKFVELGRTGIKISPIGLGIMQWGDVSIDPNSPTINKDVLEIYQVALEGGINFFDTAEAYGSGRSEIQLGRCLKQVHSHNIVIATKFMPYPWRLSKGELRAALIRSLNRLGLSRVDLYQMHWPIPILSIQSWMDAMADAVSDGLIRAVGVSNYSPNQTKVAFEALTRRQIPLASNQVRYSLLFRRPERSGLIELGNKLGITIIAYSPLEKGVLTGKFTPENPPNGFRAWRYNKNYLTKISPLLDELRQIGQAHHGMTAGQVALNWVTCKGAVPIPGARNRAQAQENIGGLGWQLSSEEVTSLDSINEEVTL